MPTIYLSPYELDSNEYIDNIRHLLRTEGYTVEPLQLKKISRVDLKNFFNQGNYLIFHWVESFAFKSRNGKKVFNLSGFLKWVCYCLIGLFARARVVYFIHNHVVHDTQGRDRLLSSYLINVFCRVATIRIVHDPNYCKQYKASYVPHPLYKLETSGTLNPDIASDFSILSNQCWSIIGAIRPYKKIEDVILNWPKDKFLFIAGKASPEYLQKIQEIIIDKNLSRCIKVHGNFLTKNELNLILGNSCGVILPHESGSGLVSGAFFEALSHGCAVITRSSPFTQTMSKSISQVYNFELPSELDAILRRHHEIDLFDAKDSIKRKAEELFGEANCLKLLRKALD